MHLDSGLIGLGKTLLVKITIILYFLVTIPNQAIFAAPPGDNATLKIAKAVLRLLGMSSDDKFGIDRTMILSCNFR